MVSANNNVDRTQFLILKLEIYLVVRELAEKIDIALSCPFVHIYPLALDSKRVMRIAANIAKLPAAAPTMHATMMRK